MCLVIPVVCTNISTVSITITKICRDYSYPWQMKYLMSRPGHSIRRLLQIRRRVVPSVKGRSLEVSPLKEPMEVRKWKHS
jgi:hypothetical protein